MSSGRGAAAAHVLWEHEVAGSNPAAPTNLSYHRRLWAPVASIPSMAGPRAQRRRLSAWILVVVGLVAACGGSTPSPSSGISQATPKPTGDPHLRDPAQIGQVYRALREQGLNIVGTTARAGKDPVSIVTGTYAGWPLRLSQYASTRLN